MQYTKTIGGAPNRAVSGAVGRCRPPLPLLYKQSSGPDAEAGAGGVPGRRQGGLDVYALTHL